MNAGDLLRAGPYKARWHLRAARGKTERVVFYCTDPLDYVMWKPVQKHLPFEVPIVVARSEKTEAFLAERGVPFSRMPAFPRTVIMARHLAHKFPVRAIKKINVEHGLYNFKRWTATKNFNAFTVYMASSESHAAAAAARGVTTARPIGYAKLDCLFDGSCDAAFQDSLRQRLGLDPAKKTVLFTSTWDVGNMSALDRWLDRVGELGREFNVLITVHTWTDPAKVAKLKTTPGTHFLTDFDVAPWFSIVDALVGDSSSIIGEFCALDRPIVTFAVPDGERTVPEIKKMIADISTRQVEDFDALCAALRHALANPHEKAAERKEANRVMHHRLDGKAGVRAAECILETLGND